nr:MAG TPA: hypothetical protein [Caudoviricetes sp.]
MIGCKRLGLPNSSRENEKSSAPVNPKPPRVIVIN